MTRLLKLKSWSPESLFSRTTRRLLLAATAAGLLASCSTLNYYAQAAHGQLALLADARPVDDWLADQNTDARLRTRLEKASAIRAYAARQLALPDNKSYKNYAALQRPFVLWNVVATPELSLKPMEWCFPIAGCVAYRGYYSKDDARAYARELRAEGMDVQVGGVPAYSTLGWFNDPLVSTFINYPDAELARLIFHELAHQVLYISGDSQFNESFATAVEEAGVQQWLDAQNDARLREAYSRYAARKQDFLELLLSTRKELEALYKSDADTATKRSGKARIFEQLKARYKAIKETQWEGYAGYDRFFAEPLSNAHLASIATYHDYVPAFRAMLAREGSYPRFYAAVRALAEMEKPERERRLKQVAVALQHARKY